MQQVGKVSWSDLEFEAKKNKKFVKKDTSQDYLKLVNGHNVVRIVTDPYRYVFHNWKPGDAKSGGDWVDPKKASQYGETIKCSKPHGDCPLCNLKDRPKEKFYIGVLVDNQVKILDAASGIVQKIKLLKDNPKWGSPLGYDVDIVKNADAEPANIYNVVPDGGPYALTPEQLEIIEKFDLSKLETMVTPPTPDKVLNRMKWTAKKICADGKAVPAALALDKPAETSTVTEETSTATTEDGVSTDFPEA